MKNARGMLAGLYILISVFSFLSLSGCEGGFYTRENRGYGRGDERGERHYYRDGRWYRRGPSGADIVVSALFVGALIESLPPSYTTVEVEGTPYYHDNRYYYRQSPKGGYMVVQEPARGKSHPQSNNRGRQEKGDEHSQENRGYSH